MAAACHGAISRTRRDIFYVHAAVDYWKGTWTLSLQKPIIRESIQRRGRKKKKKKEKKGFFFLAGILSTQNFPIFLATTWHSMDAKSHLHTILQPNLHAYIGPFGIKYELDMHQ